MKKTVWLSAMLAISATLYAQNSSLDEKDLLVIFEQYNPAVLERASIDNAYRDILTELANSYSVAQTGQSRYELIALALNFDNSLRLQALRDQYFEGHTLQTMSGVSILDTLDQSTRTELRELMGSILNNTITVRNLQVKDYKTQLKQIRKNNALSIEQKRQRMALLSSNIKEVKQEIRNLKHNSKQKIKDTADAYFAEMKADYISSQPQQLRAEQSVSWDIKANHKKPVAK